MSGIYSFYMKHLAYFISIFVVMGLCVTCKHNSKLNSDSAEKSLLNTSAIEEPSSVLPTAEEIEITNARLPVNVNEATLFTKVEYDSNTKVQTFYYRYTEDIDYSLISPLRIQLAKASLRNTLQQNKNSMARIDAGMTYLYVYCSKDDAELYEIRINKSDF